jgi:hypothetical protein
MGDILEMALPPECHFDPGSGVYCSVAYALCPPGPAKDQVVTVCFSKGCAQDCLIVYGGEAREERPVLLAQKRKKKDLPISCAAENSKKLRPKLCCR